MDYALSWGLDSIQQRVYSLADTLRRKLSTIDGITVTDEGVEKCGIVTFVSQQLEPADIKTTLAAHKINVSTSSGSGSLVSIQERGLTEVLRASLHYFNPEEEIDYFTATLSKLFRNPIGA